MLEQLIAETVFQMWDPRRPDGVLNIFDGHIVWKEEGSKMDGWLVCLTPESRPRLQVWECSTLGACMKLKPWECWSATLAWPPSTSQTLYHFKLRVTTYKQGRPDVLSFPCIGPSRYPIGGVKKIDSCHSTQLSYVPLGAEDPISSIEEHTIIWARLTVQEEP